MKKTYILLSVVCFVFAFFFSFCLVGYSFLGLLIGVLGAYFFFMGLTVKIIPKTRRAVTFLALLGIALTAVLGGIILSDVRGDADAPCDYVIVLGAGIRGETPSRTLSDRLERTLEYMNKYPDCVAIVSGGQGEDEDITEALAMERYLISHGIEEERIVKEENSRNTHENMVFSREIIEGLGGGRVAVISSDYHIYRARRLAENAGMTPVMLPAKTGLPVLFLNCTLREAFALVKAHLVFM